MISEVKLLAMARPIAELFISQEAPQELPYFPVLWGHVKSGRQAGFDRKRPKWHPWAEGMQRLAFAEGQPLDLLSPFVLVGVLAALDELNAGVMLPNQGALEKGIAAFAGAMGASEPKAEKMARSLAPIIVQRWTDLQKETEQKGVQQSGERIMVRVDSSGAIQLAGRKPPTGRKPPEIQRRLRELLSQLLREQDVYWWEGYVIFNGWRRRPIADPPHQFSVDCSRLNDILGKICLGLCAARTAGTRLSEGAWRLVVPEQVDLAGEIVAARQEIEEARRDIGNTSYDDALEKADSAVKKDPHSYRAMETFLEALDNISGKTVPSAQLRDIYLRLRRMVSRLENAGEIIDALMAEGTLIAPAEDLIVARQQVSLRLNDVQSLYRRLDARLQGLPPSPEDQRTLDLLVYLVKRYRRSKGRAQEKAFDELTSIEAIREAVGRATWRAMRCLKVRGPQSELAQFGSEHEESPGDGKDRPLHEDQGEAMKGRTRREYERELTHNDVANTVFAQMTKVLSKGFEPVECDSLEESMSRLKSLLTRKSVESLVGISPEQQQDVRTMRCFITAHAAEKRDMRGWPEYGLLPEGWDNERWYAALDAEEDLLKKVDAFIYYRIFGGTVR